ncbi:MAG: GNAT family N-acetyltransferase [Planctomycetota bacterium]|nr:MAG: GNAT family N-acetyltransferase [Planctomycetota bacterium]
MSDDSGCRRAGATPSAAAGSGVPADGATGPLRLRRPRPEDLEALAALEARSYPPDEAAPREVLADRIARAPACFLLAEGEDGALLGFVCGTRSAAPTLTHASMREHDPAGASLCIHSVVVDPAHRRRGLGRRLVAAYLERVGRDLSGVERVLLICKQHLVGFYEQNGFRLVGPSSVVHGRDPWFEMRRPLCPAGEGPRPPTAPRQA